MNYRITFSVVLFFFMAITLSAQVIQEVELRPDGIVIPRLETSSVSTPTRGQLVYQDSDDTIYFFDGTDWLPVGAGGATSGHIITDDDGDTFVTVEDFADSDEITFNLSGSTRLEIREESDGVFVFRIPEYNAGNTVFGHNPSNTIDTTGGNGSSNTVFGANSGSSLTIGTSNTFIGHSSGQNNTIGSNNTMVGHLAGNRQSTGEWNLYLGNQAASQIDTSYDNTIIGGLAANQLQNGDGNVIIGRGAGEFSDTVFHNTILGSFAGSELNGDNNTFIGNGAGNQLFDDDGNVFIGSSSGNNQVDGEFNVYLGTFTSNNLDSSSNNTILGGIAAHSMTRGESNVIIGRGASEFTNSQFRNVVIGAFAAQNSESYANVIIGEGAGDIAGSSNVYIGQGTGRHNSGRENIFIGPSVGTDDNDQTFNVDHELRIDNSSTSNPLLHGFFDLDSLVINGDLTVLGTLSPPSDKNLKENFQDVDYQKVLSQVGDLDITQWNYKDKRGDHLGPMAQDFYQAFGLGTSDKSIATVDADGVALASIKALLNRVVELEKINAQVMEENAGMRADIADIRAMLATGRSNASVSTDSAKE